jgi:hypothetical protein
VVEISYPPYSPDLTLAAFILFPKVKTAPKGRRFPDVEDIEENVTCTVIQFLWMLSMTVLCNF